MFVCFAGQAVRGDPIRATVLGSFASSTLTHESDALRGGLLLEDAGECCCRGLLYCFVEFVVDRTQDLVLKVVYPCIYSWSVPPCTSLAVLRSPLL